MNFFKNKKIKKCFTIIEMSIVIGILAIIGFFSMDFLIDTSSRLSVDSTSADIVQFFKKVQNQNKLYGIQGVTDEQQVYYGIGFKRDSDNKSSYYSFKKTPDNILEVFHLPNNVYFSSLDVGETLNIRFCANMDYKLPTAPDSLGGLEFLCDANGSMICAELFEIFVKSRLGNYEKRVFINTSESLYSCKPEIYVKKDQDQAENCIFVETCINGTIYPNPCDYEYEEEIVEYCFDFTDNGNSTCTCN